MKAEVNIAWQGRYIFLSPGAWRVYYFPDEDPAGRQAPGPLAFTGKRSALTGEFSPDWTAGYKHWPAGFLKSIALRLSEEDVPPEFMEEQWSAIRTLVRFANLQECG